MHSNPPLAREPQHPQGTSVAGEPPPDEIIEAVLLLRGISAREERTALLDRLATQLPAERRHFDRAEYERLHGAREDDLAVLRSVTAAAGLVTRRVSRTGRYVRLTGTVRNFETTFGVKFLTMEGPLGSYRSHRNPAVLPPRLAGIVDAVVGFDARQHPLPMNAEGAVRAAHAGPLRPQDVAAAYDFPQQLDGCGRRIGIISLGGGFHHADMAQYFSSFKLRLPNIQVITTHRNIRNDPAPRAQLAAFVSGALKGKSPSIPAGGQARFAASAETTLDLQVAGSLANGADLVVCFGSQTNAGIFLALAEFLECEYAPVDVISVSWSGPESQYEPGDRWALDTAIEAATLCGISVCCSSGDSGDGSVKGSPPEVMYPPANPWVLACGGTHLAMDGLNRIETVWDEKVFGGRKSSGGGVSALYAMPSWQEAAGVQAKLPSAGRGVPDVAAKADIAGGFPVCMGGVEADIGGGTSAATPMWAALLARIAQGFDRRLGCVAPLFYEAQFRPCFHDIVQGSNGGFYASPGWDACTGWGSPVGTRLMKTLAGKDPLPPA